MHPVGFHGSMNKYRGNTEKICGCQRQRHRHQPPRQHRSLRRKRTQPGRQRELPQLHEQWRERCDVVREDNEPPNVSENGWVEAKIYRKPWSSSQLIRGSGFNFATSENFSALTLGLTHRRKNVKFGVVTTASGVHDDLTRDSLHFFSVLVLADFCQTCFSRSNKIPEVRDPADEQCSTPWSSLFTAWLIGIPVLDCDICQ